MRTIKQGKSLTIILSDGVVITDTNVSKETEAFIKENSDNEEEVKKYFMIDVEEKEEIRKERALIKDIAKSSIFKYDEATGITTIPSVSEVSVPKHLIDKIKQVEGTEAEESYLNFWRLACRNPNEYSRENLLWFLQTHNFTILKSGLFVAYRNVVKVKGQKLFVTDLYKNIKFVQKKSPKKFKVIKTSQDELKTKKLDYVVKNGEVEMGNLEDLNKQSSESHAFTDKYTGKFQIKLGQPVTMARDKCDSNPNNSCSAGLHVACKDWGGLKQFGDTSIAVLVNPIDVVAVPKDSGYSKMRVCQYFPLKVVEWANNKIVEDIKEGDSLDFWEAIIEGEVNNTDSNPHKLKVPDMPVQDYNKYILNVKQIRDQLKNKMIK